MKTRSVFNNFSLLVTKNEFFLLIFYSSCPRPRRRTKRSVRTQTKIICCFWLLQATNMKEMNAGSTGPPVQLTPLSPNFRTPLFKYNKPKGQYIWKHIADYLKNKCPLN